MLTPEQVTPFFEHEDPYVRKLAEEYFRDCWHIGAASVLDLVRAAQRFPDDDVIGFGSGISSMRVRAGDVPALLELRSAAGERLRERLDLALAHLPADVMVAARPALQAALDSLPDEVAEVLQAAWRLAEKPRDELWPLLVDACRSEPGEDTHEVLLAQLLARDPAAVWPLLKPHLDGFTDAREYHPEMSAALEVAAYGGMAEALPYFVAALRRDGDFDLESGARGLGMLGTLEALAAVRTLLPKAPWETRLYALSVPEAIKLPESEALLLDWFGQEEVLSLRTSIAAGLCRLGSAQALEPLLAMARDGDFDPQMADLEADVVGLAGLVGETFAARPHLQRQLGKLRARAEKRKELRAERARLLAEIDQLKAERARAPAVLPSLDPESTPFVRDEPKIGRNDPCPCGSGKKYKKCCGR